MKKTLLGTLLCLTLLAMCSGAAMAQAHRPMSATTTASAVNHPMKADADAGLKKIFSNLGTGTDLYDASNGYFVSGSNNLFNGQKQDIAIPFKPRANSTVTAVKAALQYFGYGTNGAQLAIYSDNGGLPGTAMAKKDLVNFGAFGSGCCVLANWKLHGTAVTAGTQYWIVGTTDSHNGDAVNTWDFVWNDAPGRFAFQQDNGGWILLTAANGYPQSAVTVLGTQP